MPGRESDCRASTIVDLKRAIVDERKSRSDLRAIRHATVDVLIELPEARQRRERDVELARSPFADLLRRVEHLSHFRADGDGGLSRGGVEAEDVAPFLPHAHQRIEPIELEKDSLERGDCRGFVGRPRTQVDLGAHAHLRSLDERGFRARRRGAGAAGDEHEDASGARAHERERARQGGRHNGTF